MAASLHGFGEAHVAHVPLRSLEEEMPMSMNQIDNFLLLFFCFAVAWKSNRTRNEVPSGPITVLEVDVRLRRVVPVAALRLQSSKNQALDLM